LFSDPAALPIVAASCPLDHDFVIGFEMTPNQIRLLASAGLPFLDISIDPLRFGRDLFFRMRSNDPSMQRMLQACHQPAEMLRDDVADLLRQAAPGQSIDGCDDGAVLFAGQTDIDASLICDAGLASIEPFIERIGQILQGRRLLLKPHPYGQTHRTITVLQAAFPGAMVVNDPIYALLSLPEIQHVVTLSSGVAEEATLFGKSVTTLITPDGTREKIGDALVSPYYRVGLEQITGGFWRALEGKAAPAEPVVAARAGRLRHSIGQAWGYTVHPRLTQRAISPGDRLSFKAGGNGAGLCLLGWSQPERAGVWTDGAMATMRVDTQGKALDLILGHRAFVRRGGEPLQVAIRVGQQDIAQHVTIRYRCYGELIIQLPAVKGCTEIALYIMGTTRPSDAGVGPDTRDLGLQLVNARVRQRPERFSTWSHRLQSHRYISHSTRLAVSILAAVFSVG
jgi:hypothetical protein